MIINQATMTFQNYMTPPTFINNTILSEYVEVKVLLANHHPHLEVVSGTISDMGRACPWVYKGVSESFQTELITK